MSLGIAFKGPEGLVLAADSRVTLFRTFNQPDGSKLVFPSPYDHAIKLLYLPPPHNKVGAISYGAGAIGLKQPRTANSFLPEFQDSLPQKRQSVKEFARSLGRFFADRWQESDMPKTPPPNENMFFFVAGFDDDKDPHGSLFEVSIPAKPEPDEKLSAVGEFGLLWGGQREIVDRLLHGYDERLLAVVQQTFEIPNEAWDPAPLQAKLKEVVESPIPYQFLPLQDCVDLSIFLLQATSTLQRWFLGIRGVGGAIDIATITRTDGLRPIQVKEIIGEHNLRLRDNRTLRQ